MGSEDKVSKLNGVIGTVVAILVATATLSVWVITQIQEPYVQKQNVINDNVQKQISDLKQTHKDDFQEVRVEQIRTDKKVDNMTEKFMSKLDEMNDKLTMIYIQIEANKKRGE